MDRQAVALEIVDRIIEDLTDRAGLRQEWDRIDEFTQGVIRGTWNMIAYAALIDADGEDE